MKRLLSLGAGAVLLLVVPAAAAPTAGSIVPGRGVAKIELGMTRAQVAAKLGAPSRAAGQERTYENAKRSILWTVRTADAGRVDKIQLAVGLTSRYPFCTAGGACLGATGGLAKLKAEFGGRLQKTEQLGYPAYLLVGTGYRGYGVYTVFVLRPDAGPRGSVARGRITNVAFGYCAGTTIC